MNMNDIINKTITKKMPEMSSAEVFSPTNIALIKYWGKRDKALNLPMTSSLSVTLPTHGSHTKITVNSDGSDQLILNQQEVNMDLPLAKRIQKFLDLFRYENEGFLIETTNNIPTAAGLASSASGFSALIAVLNKIYGWDLSLSQQSMLARMGSGSACRSFWNGFVYWEKGSAIDGTDSFAKPIEAKIPDLCIGLNLIETKQKPISSRDAMNVTTDTSPFYSLWPELVDNDLIALKKAINDNDFDYFGKIVESNAIAMHATMQTAWPPIYYSTADTIQEMNKVWELRKSGIPVFFTQDAGPNLKLVFLEKDQQEIIRHFENLEVIRCF